MPHRKGRKGHCIAKEEAKKQIGYAPDDRRPPLTEADRLARRWGVATAGQSGGGR